ncbi:MAG: copper homeostasis protein CutC [Dysgonamonadaceae bacterium]|jgi:copper homeostasis protein|nr:copper homeostasis protein CutC [Dysgonamonadaceae bacterium]
MVYLEVCSNSVHSALAAQDGGAYRVELCDNLLEGGTTPSLAQIQIARQLLNIKLNVIIRPRGGDFLYDDLEFEIMKSEIRMCGKSGCDGVVTGLLNPDGTIDTSRTKELTGIAREYNMSVTFHRAFDRCNDLFKGLEEVISTGCDRILTSGGKNSALEGAGNIRKLIEQAGERIIIMPGAGITEHNIAELVKQTGLKEFHGSFRSAFPGKMQYFNQDLNDWKEDKQLLFSDKEKIREALKQARKTF